MLRRQMELHPDKYSGNDSEVMLARELSGRVNGAYEVLRDPLKRAEYLVCLLLTPSSCPFPSSSTPPCSPFPSSPHFRTLQLLVPRLSSRLDVEHDKC
jgi:hypothetical protein